jgi:hypothetical protein
MLLFTEYSYGLFRPKERYFLVGEKLIMQTSEFQTGQTYQWKKDDNRIMDGPDYDGTTTKKLTVKHASSTSAGIYTCIVDRYVVTQIHQILGKFADQLQGFVYTVEPLYSGHPWDSSECPD